MPKTSNYIRRANRAKTTGDFIMRKTIAAVTAGLLLVAGQAAATSANPVGARVGDRIGAPAGKSSEFSGIPLPVLLIGTAVIVATVVVASDDDSESD